MAHAPPGSLVAKILLQKMTPPDSTAVDDTVCERAPTGRGPLNYLPRQASMSMRVSHRRVATSQASSNR